MGVTTSQSVSVILYLYLLTMPPVQVFQRSSPHWLPIESDHFQEFPAASRILRVLGLCGCDEEKRTSEK
jgi:hypothetical protein